MRILVVEDDPKINEFLKISLESEYFVVDTTFDGEEGVYLGTTNDYDVIILDFMLPRNTGLDICKELRTRNIKTPIIGLSVKSETVNKI